MDPTILYIALGTHGILYCEDRAALERYYTANISEKNVEQRVQPLLQTLNDTLKLEGFFASVPWTYLERHPFSRYAQMAPDRRTHTREEQMDISLSSSTNLPLPVGLTALLAPTGWGKTYLIENAVKPALVDSVSLSLSYLEPLSETSATQDVDSPGRLLALLAAAIHEEVEVVIVDSLRAFVYGASLGGTGQAGVDQMLYPQLTAIANVCARGATRMLVVLNPMVRFEEMDKYSTFKNNLTASVTATWAATADRMLETFNRAAYIDSRREQEVRPFKVPELSPTSSVRRYQDAPSTGKRTDEGLRVPGGPAPEIGPALRRLPSYLS